MKTRVYKIELLVVDTEGTGPDDVRVLLEQTKYVHPKVVSLEERDVEWSDDHPLNQREEWRAEYERLFNDDGRREDEDNKQQLFEAIFGMKYFGSKS